MAALLGLLFVLLFLISCFLLIIGLIKPDLFSRWGAVRNRKRVFVVFFPLMIVFFIIIVIIAHIDEANKVSNTETLAIQKTTKTQPQEDPKQQLAEAEDNLRQNLRNDLSSFWQTILR